MLPIPLANTETWRQTASVVHVVTRLQTKPIQTLLLFSGTEQEKSKEIP